jgi:hypothetical protein
MGMYHGKKDFKWNTVKSTPTLSAPAVLYKSSSSKSSFKSGSTPRIEPGAAFVRSWSWSWSKRCCCGTEEWRPEKADVAEWAVHCWDRGCAAEEDEEDCQTGKNWAEEIAATIAILTTGRQKECLEGMLGELQSTTGHSIVPYWHSSE